MIVIAISVFRERVPKCIRPSIAFSATASASHRWALKYSPSDFVRCSLTSSEYSRFLETLENKAASAHVGRLAQVTVTLATVTALAGCLVPEKFTAQVDIQSDAGYTFRYSGTAIQLWLRHKSSEPGF